MGLYLNCLIISALGHVFTPRLVMEGLAVRSFRTCSVDRSEARRLLDEVLHYDSISKRTLSNLI